MATNLRPIGNNLLVRRAAAEDKTPGGLYIPDKAQNRPHRGTVIAASPGYVNDHGVFIDTVCRVGDVVLYAAGLGADVQLDGKDYVVISEDGVIAILSGEES